MRGRVLSARHFAKQVVLLPPLTVLPGFPILRDSGAERRAAIFIHLFILHMHMFVPKRVLPQSTSRETQVEKGDVPVITLKKEGFELQTSNAIARYLVPNVGLSRVTDES